MNHPDLLQNGIDGQTGEYLCSPGSPPKPPSSTDAEHLDATTWRWRKWWTENYRIDDPLLAPTQGVDPCEISAAGWGVIFASNVPQKHREALQPLLEHRKRQAGKFYRSYDHEGPNQSAADFLTSHDAPSGPANPENVPYYLLLVGDPEALPFRFQYELDVQYAVGRLHFDTADEYRDYSQSVIQAEGESGQKNFKNEKRLTFFSVRKPNDLASERTTDRLVVPLTQNVLDARHQGWAQCLYTGLDADRGQLLRILGGEETPNLAFIACHGVRFDASPEEQREMQGSLVCAEWPGPGHQPDRDRHILSAADLEDRPNLFGLIAFTFACYSGGTPEYDGFDFEAPGQARRISPRPFVSRLGQRLLGNRNGGALALIAHVDRAWTASFHHAVTDKANPEVFKSTLQRLLDGHPVGSATEYINQRYAELSVRLSNLWDHELSHLERPNSDLLLRTRLANNDARSYVVLGDPAVRLVGAPAPCMDTNVPPPSRTI